MPPLPHAVAPSTGPVARRGLAAVWVLAALLAGILTAGLPAAPAFAHTALVSSDPADGARVPIMPEHVALVFTEEIDASMVQVIVNSGGRARRAEGITVDGARVVAPVPAESAESGDGEVGVLYRVVSADGHPVSGRVTFTVAQASPSTPPSSAAPTTGATSPAAATPSATTTGPTAAAPARPATPTGSRIGNTMMVGLTVVAALALLVIGAVVVRSERRRR